MVLDGGIGKNATVRTHCSRAEGVFSDRALLSTFIESWAIRWELGRERATRPPPYYMERARNIVEQVRRFDLIRPGDRLLEIGSGWVAWESTVLRLFFDVQVTLFDVWDDRQFAPVSTVLS